MHSDHGHFLFGLQTWAGPTESAKYTTDEKPIYFNCNTVAIKVSKVQ